MRDNSPKITLDTNDTRRHTLFMDNATQTKDKTMTNQAETIDNILAKIAREVRTERAAKAEHAAQRDAQRDARRVEIAEYKRRGGVLGGVGGGIA